MDEAQADVANPEQGVSRANAEWLYANNNLHRVEPLLAKQYVTVDQVDQARTLEVARSEALKQAQSQLKLSQARCNQPRRNMSAPRQWLRKARPSLSNRSTL